MSSRKQPFIGFDPKREAGNDLLTVRNLTKSLHGEVILKDISFTVKKGDKIVLLGRNDIAKTMLLNILAGEIEPDSGSYTWGVTTLRGYFPTDNSKYFNSDSATLVDWLRQYSEEKDESFIRGFLGKVLFSRDESLKKPDVLSGGEKVRCMFAKIMLSGANVLLLDGPTNHLDLESISAVNEGVKRFKGTVVFTSHDHEFIQTIADRIIEIDVGLKEDKYMTYEEYADYQKKK